MHPKLVRLAKRAAVIQLFFGSESKTAIMSVAKSYCRQQTLLKAFLVEDTTEINPIQNVVTSSDRHSD